MVGGPIVDAVARELDLNVWHRIVEPDHLLLTIQRLLAEQCRRR